MGQRGRLRIALVLATAVAARGAAAQAPPSDPGRHLVQITSTADGSPQPSYLTLPTGFDASSGARPLLVVLHTWSFDLEQRQPELEADADARGWILLAPNFRGRNDHPGACGSALAQQDILDAVDWARAHYPVDGRRIYLTGMSGGGYLTMLVAARHPERWAAASAWVGISDLATWYTTHAADTYGTMMRQCLGGAPGDGDSLRAEYDARSPLRYLGRASAVPFDLAAGVRDTVVPPIHTLRAFNALARAGGTPPISQVEMNQLVRDRHLTRPAAADTSSDSLVGKAVALRRTAGPSRVTIFDGGHEWVPRAALAWLADRQGTTPRYVTTGLFIASIEEGARIFTPARLLPFEHPEALGHEFPTVLQLHGGEDQVLLVIGQAVGLRLGATLQRYPTQPDTLWPYAPFAPPPVGEIRAAPVVTQRGADAPLPGLRAVAVVDRFPVSFIVDTRGLSLADRHMRQATTMGLDVTRAEFFAALMQAAQAAPAIGPAVIVYAR